LSLLAGILLGCSGDGAGPTGPAIPEGAGLRLIALGGDTLRGIAGDTVPGTSVLAVTPGGVPVRDARVRWKVVNGGGRVVRTVTSTDANGVASAGWILGTDLTLPQVLSSELASPDDRGPYGRSREPVLFRASALLPMGVLPTATDTNRLAIDTIGAVLGSAVQLRLRLPDGRPIVGATIDFTVVRGGGRVGSRSAVTDSAGHAGTVWQLGDSAGAQEVAAEVRPAPGQPASRSLIRALSLAGAPVAIAPAGDTIRIDALGDTLQMVQLRDRAGNVTYGRASWTSLTPAIVGTSDETGIISIRNGLARVAISHGALSRTIPVVVSQTAATIVTGSAAVAFNWLGARSRVTAEARDRRGVPISGAAVSWRSRDSTVAAVDSQGVVRAMRDGITQLIASYQGASVKVSAQVVQQPAAISVLPATDTLELDSTRTPTVVVMDSGGSVIPSPTLQVTLSDTTVIGVDPSGALQATLPGTTTLTYRAGTVSASIDRVVEGTAILVSGQRVTAPMVLSGQPSFLITNGRVRIGWSSDHTGSIAMWVRLGSVWQPATSPVYGDWLYITAGVRTAPTLIAITENSVQRVGFRVEYANHWFLPQLEGLPPSIQPQPYPFTRTVWLGERDNGYYSWVDLVNNLHLTIVEHETGFGGLWGPATIRTNALAIRTDTLSKTVTYNGNPGHVVTGAIVDAAEFVRDNDPVRRVLVPLPESPLITPVFPGWGYGSVYRYSSLSQSFGVYMYATAVGSGPSASQICGAAWAHAPFPLRTLTPAEVASCGPASP
jgi:hypothetical protein